MAIQSAGAANGSYASLGQFPVSHCGSSMAFTEADTKLNRVIGQVSHVCMCVCVSLSDHRYTWKYSATDKVVCNNSHLLACKQLPLVFIDDGVTSGHFAIFIPCNRTQEVSRVSQTIGSCKTHAKCQSKGSVGITMMTMITIKKNRKQLGVTDHVITGGFM